MRHPSLGRLEAPRMRICVVGLGYIGLPTATLAAAAGHEVVGVDINPELVRALNVGRLGIEEPGLKDLVRQVVSEGRLVATGSVTPADVFLIAVPTPILQDKTADLKFVREATLSVVPHLRPGALFLIESTIPPGCTEEVVVPILEQSGLKAGEDFLVAHCPERVIPGRIIHELVHNDRVIGGINEESRRLAASFYSSFVEGTIYTCGLKTAELTKLVENAYRDVNIAFANEVALICDRLGVDVWEVVRLASKHPRVNILSPGPGVGGHCIAVDPWFLADAFPDDARLISTARAINDARPDYIANKIAQEIENCGIEEPVVTCLGMTYKANVDDLRGSPSLQVVARLLEKGYEVRACDPYANGRWPLRCVPVEEAVRGADALVLLVDHKEYCGLDPAALAKLMRGRIIVDTRGAWRHSMGAAGTLGQALTPVRVQSAKPTGERV